MPRYDNKPGLEERLRKSGSVKRGYMVFVVPKDDYDEEIHGMQKWVPARADTPGAEWKFVLRKQRDLDHGVTLMTFPDDTQLLMSDHGALFSYRPAPESEGKAEEKDS